MIDDREVGGWMEREKLFTRGLVHTCTVPRSIRESP